MLRPVRVRNYTSVMNARGISTERMLRGTGIEVSRLDDPDYLVHPAQCQAAIGNMIELSGDAAIGFDAGRSTELFSLGVVGGALLSCSVLRQTLDVWDRYALPLLGIMSRLTVEEIDPERIALTIEGPRYGDPINVFCVEEILALTYKAGTTMSGMLPDLLEVEFAYQAPKHRQRYEEMFQCPIRYNAARTRAVIARHWIDAPLLSRNRELHRVCLSYCGRVAQDIADDRTVTTRLQGLFSRQPRAIPSLDEAARELRLSSRTLKRRLQQQGLNYQTLVRRFRTELASEYLGEGRMPAKRVADLLGFDDVHSFRRAFKTWTGETVADYRVGLMAGGRAV